MLRVVVLILLSCAMPAVLAKDSKLNVFTCEPEWAALANTLAGELLDIDSATTYMQDPHHIQARPSLIAKTRRADLLICTGAELETGWLPLLLRKSGNPDIQPGSVGYFLATDQVPLLNKRESVDRSEGDVHAGGNPHIHFDPRRMLQVADALAAVLGEKMPAQQAVIQQRLLDFKQSLTATLDSQSHVIKQLRGKQIVVHHDSWVYLQDWLGLVKVAELEPKPGLPPSATHLTSLLGQLQQQAAIAIVYASYQDDKPASWLSSRTGIPALRLPYSVEDWRKPDALIDFYGQLLEGLNGTSLNSH